MNLRFLPVFLLLLAACGGDGGGEEWSRKKKDDEYALPVRVATPGRAEVEDYVETQATLETEQQVEVTAEVDGRIVARHFDVGDVVGLARNGADPLLLAEIDDRDLKLAEKDAGIELAEKQGAIRELELAKKQAKRELEQAQVALDETKAVLARTEAGRADGTISLEEHETASFARTLADSKVQSAQAALDKAEVALELGAVAVRQAEVALERASLALEKASVKATFGGVVTYCAVRVGQRVRTGDLLFRIEDPKSLIAYGDLPLRQAPRVKVGNLVRLGSNALGRETTGKVVLVAPTVTKTGQRIKVAVDPAPGFKPGVFVTLRVVTETRANALVVPKRAILHDDEEGAYLFTVADGVASRVWIKTGFQRDDKIEVTEGIGEGDAVVVEGQDTLSDGAKVEIKTE